MELFKDGEHYWLNEFHHNVEAVPQPVPFLTQSKKGLKCSDGGNCYALALLAVLRKFGLRPVSDNREACLEAIDLFEGKYASGDPNIEQNSQGMEKALARFPELEVIEYFEPAFEVDQMYGGAFGICLNFDRVKKFEDKLREGYVIISTVYANLANTPPSACEQSDHWVVVDGVRERREPIYYAQGYVDQYGHEDWFKNNPRNAGDSMGERCKTEFRIVDSSSSRPGPRWIDSDLFATLHGGSEGFFVRLKNES